MKTVQIPVGGTTIDGTLLTPPEPRGNHPGVLFLHGWGGSAHRYLEIAQHIAGMGCVCLTINLRGHARTAELRHLVTPKDGLEDARAAFDRLLGESGVDARRMGVVGSSYGGYLAALLTEERSVLWLGLRAPAIYKDEGWEVPKERLRDDPDFYAYRHRRLTPHENRALKACSRFRGDALLIASENDHVVPHQVVANYAVALCGARSLEYEVLQGADHALSDPAQRSAYEALLAHWFERRLTQPPPS